MGTLNALNEGLPMKLDESPPSLPSASFDCFPASARTYNQDGLMTMHDCSFIEEPRFANAYRDAIQTGSWSGPWGQAQIHWRAHVLCWAGQIAQRLQGDFVECGVDHGGTAMLLLKYLDFDNSSRRMYLYDTFCGLDPTLSSEKELANYTGIYRDCYDEVRQRFESFSNVIVCRGSIPASLSKTAPEQVAFLHIDLNAANPERAAIEFFWDRLTPGAMIVLDDYCWVACHAQKLSMDEFAKSVDCPILSLPTGQGLLQKR